MDQPTTDEPPKIGQALLFSRDIEQIEAAEEAQGIYTLERVRVQRPGLIDAIVQLTAQGEGQLSMAKKLNCHHRTVSAVQRHPDFAESIDIARSKMVARIRSAGSKLVELIDNSPETVPANVRALAAVQLLQHAELLDGRPTTRSEELHRVDLVDGWEETLKRLPAEDVREIGSEVGENVALKALTEAPTAGAGLAGGDVQSLVCEPTTEAYTQPDTDSGTDHIEIAPDSVGRSAGRAGGGMLDLATPPDYLTHPSSEEFYPNGSAGDMRE